MLIPAFSHGLEAAEESLIEFPSSLATAGDIEEPENVPDKYDMHAKRRKSKYCHSLVGSRIRRRMNCGDFMALQFFAHGVKSRMRSQEENSVAR